MIVVTIQIFFLFGRIPFVSLSEKENCDTNDITYKLVLAVLVNWHIQYQNLAFSIDILVLVYLSKLTNFCTRCRDWSVRKCCPCSNRVFRLLANNTCYWLKQITWFILANSRCCLLQIYSHVESLHCKYTPFDYTFIYADWYFNICCPRYCVSRHNGGTSGAPLKPLRVDSALRAWKCVNIRGLQLLVWVCCSQEKKNLPKLAKPSQISSATFFIEFPAKERSGGNSEKLISLPVECDYADNSLWFENRRKFMCKCLNVKL